MPNEEIQAAIEAAATEGIKRAKSDEGEVEMRPVDELIKADTHLRNTQRRRLGIRMTRLIPPGGSGRES